MTTDLFSVAGKNVLVTGGTRGIGYMIAEGFLKAGARVLITSRKADACEAAEKALSTFGPVTAIASDLSDVDQSQALATAIGEHVDELHVLVNNAGATWGAAFDEFPVSGWDKIFNLNVRSVFVLTQQLRPLLEKAGTPADPARVINIGSIDGIAVPTSDNYSYGASKAAVHHLTKHMARELTPSILVNAIAPGPFPTKMMATVLAEHGDELRAQSPVGRLGEPEDAAGLAIFLSSRASTYITGATIPLDGGLSTTVQVS